MQLRAIFSKIRSSPQRLASFGVHCRVNNLDPLKPPIDIDVRWKSTVTLLEYAHRYQKPLTDFVASDPKLDSTKLTLLPAEYARIPKLLRVLGVCDMQLTLAGPDGTPFSSCVDLQEGRQLLLAVANLVPHPPGRHRRVQLHLRQARRPDHGVYTRDGPGQGGDAGGPHRGARKAQEVVQPDSACCLRECNVWVHRKALRGSRALFD